MNDAETNFKMTGKIKNCGLPEEQGQEVFRNIEIIEVKSLNEEAYWKCYYDDLERNQVNCQLGNNELLTPHFPNRKKKLKTAEEKKASSLLSKQKYYERKWKEKEEKERAKAELVQKLGLQNSNRYAVSTSNEDARKIIAQLISNGEDVDYIDRGVLKTVLNKFNINFQRELCIKYLEELIKHWNIAESAVSKNYLYDLSHCIASGLNTFYHIFHNHVEKIVEVTCSYKQLKCLLTKTDNRSAVNLENLKNWPHLSFRIELPGFKLTRTHDNYCEFYIARQSNRDIVAVNTALRFESEPAVLIPIESVIKVLNRLQHFIIESQLNVDQKLQLIDHIMEFESNFKLCGANVEARTEYKMYLNEYTYVRKIDEYPLKSGEIYLYEYCLPQIVFSVDSFEVGGVLNSEWLAENLGDLILCECKLCDEELGSILSGNLNEHLLNYHGFETDWSCVKCDRTFATNDLSWINWNHCC